MVIRYLRDMGTTISRSFNAATPAEASNTVNGDGSQGSEKEKPEIIGNPDHIFWLWTKTDGFDLTHPDTPFSLEIKPRIKLATANSPIVIAPTKTALLIIDMQNIWLSEPLRARGPGHDAEAVILKTAIPAARMAGIQVVWLNWGITDKDLEKMSPTTLRIFSFHLDGDLLPEGHGIGSKMGSVEVGDGESVDGGRMLMANQWNTDIHDGPLAAAYQEGLKAMPPDVLIYKNRISGICDSMTQCTDFLIEKGITTLLFTGISTEMCVLATMQDANLKDFDTVLLADGCGTINGDAAKQVSERSSKRAWGFLSSCKELEHGVHTIIS